MTDQPVETPASWLQWILSFVPPMPSRSMQAALVAVVILNLWAFDKLPRLPSFYPEITPSVAICPAPVSYVTASEVAPLIVDIAGMKARLGELEARMLEHEKAKAPITTGSISKPKKQ